MKEYKEVINKWIINRKTSIDEKQLCNFFKNGFIFTQYPNKTYFGSRDFSISFIIGGIYLLAYVHRGNDKGIWMLQDKIHSDLKEDIFDQHEVKSTKNSEIKLYWLHMQDIKNLNFINDNDEIWDSYHNASGIIKTTKHWNFTREDFIKNKDKLTAFWRYPSVEITSMEALDNSFQEKLCEEKDISPNELKKKILMFDKKPEKVEVITYAYKRNPYVVIEVLNRSSGICELCKNKAPFFRKTDGTPYLEIHHSIPLSENGDDTVENTIALCPNCHRKMHYGI